MLLLWLITSTWLSHYWFPSNINENCSTFCLLKRTNLVYNIRHTRIILLLSKIKCDIAQAFSCFQWHQEVCETISTPIKLPCKMPMKFLPIQYDKYFHQNRWTQLQFQRGIPSILRSSIFPSSKSQSDYISEYRNIVEL